MSKFSQFSLLRQRRFAPFFWTQFLGAFNDNVFKTALLTILTYEALDWTSIDINLLNNLIPGLFILPFVVFSATAGQLADKLEKSCLARYVKVLEIFIMSIAAVGWMTYSLWLLILAIVGMGVHSTLFGPVKYAYLPQKLRQDELVGGNGVIEMGTFFGILLGEVLGAVLVVHKPWGIELVAGGTVAIAVLGWLFSRHIPLTPAAEPALKVNWNPMTEMVRNLGFSRKNQSVFVAMLANSWFWFYGAILLAQFPLYAKNYLHGDHSVFVLLLTVFSLGVGAGSLLCERLSGHKVETGLVSFGSIGLSVFGLDLFLASISYTNTDLVNIGGFVQHTGSWRILFDCLMIGLFGGFYIVPLFTVIQTRCDPRHLSRTIAGMNIMNALFMVMAALLALVLLQSGFTIPQIFLVTAILNALFAIYIFTVEPEYLVRFMAWILIRTIHRVKTINSDLIPADGAAVLVCNHVSYVDAIVIMAASPRSIRFVMDYRIFKIPVLAWLFRAAKAIPIAQAKENPELMERAFAQIAAALEDGDLVCLFLEGKLTSTSKMNECYGGIMKLVERTPVPIIPMALIGLWASMWTRGAGNPFHRSFKRGLLSTLQLAVGKPVALEQATPEYLQQQVQALREVWQ